MSSGRTGPAPHVKKFVFRSLTDSRADGEAPRYLEVLVPELLRASYASYTWASAPVLAWFLWSQRAALPGKRVVELGAGTALPGILAAKCGAHVTLTDSFTLTESLRHLATICETNGLTPGRDIRVLGLTWGLFLGDTLDIVHDVDLIIASDCFYDPTVFEDILATVAFILDTSDAKFLCAYQERSSDWSIEALLKKWGLKCCSIDLESAGEDTGIDFRELMGDHSVHLLEITSL